VCEHAANPESAIRSITIDNLDIIFNLNVSREEKQYQPTESDLNSSGSKQKEHDQRTELEINSSGLKQEEHHPRTKTRFFCMCAKQSNSPGGQFICECFSMAEPYMLTGYTLGNIEEDGGEQQQKKKSCSQRRQHSHYKTRISSKQAVQPVKPTDVVSHHGSQVIGTQNSKTRNQNILSCNCWCHDD
jgi:hypothetical protein